MHKKLSLKNSIFTTLNCSTKANTFTKELLKWKAFKIDSIQLIKRKNKNKQKRISRLDKLCLKMPEGLLVNNNNINYNLGKMKIVVFMKNRLVCYKCHINWISHNISNLKLHFHLRQNSELPIPSLFIEKFLNIIMPYKQNQMLSGASFYKEFFLILL